MEAQQAPENPNKRQRIEMADDDSTPAQLQQREATLSEQQAQLDEAKAVFEQENAAFALKEAAFAQEKAEFDQNAADAQKARDGPKTWKKLYDDIIPAYKDLLKYYEDPESIDYIDDDEDAAKQAEKIVVFSYEQFLRFNNAIPCRDYRAIFLEMIDELAATVPLPTEAMMEITKKQLAYLPLRNAVFEKWNWWKKDEASEEKWRGYIKLKNESQGGELQGEDIVHFGTDGTDGGSGFNKLLDLIRETRWRSKEEKDEFVDRVWETYRKRHRLEREYVELD